MIRHLRDKDFNWFFELFERFADDLLSDPYACWDRSNSVLIGEYGKGFISFKHSGDWWQISELVSISPGLGRALVNEVPTPTIVATLNAGKFYRKCGFYEFGKIDNLEVYVKES
jgi:hypothetical protein